MDDIIDETTMETDRLLGAPEDSVVMTTWHDDQPLSVAIFQLFRVAVPDEYYLAETQSSLAVVIGSHEWAEEIRLAFKNSDEFMKHFLSK